MFFCYWVFGRFFHVSPLEIPFFNYRLFTVFGPKISGLGTVDIGFFDILISAIFSHDSNWETGRLTLTEKYDIVLRLDNMLTFTDLILHTRIAKINVLRYKMCNTGFFNILSCKWGIKIPGCVLYYNAIVLKCFAYKLLTTFFVKCEK